LHKYANRDTWCTMRRVARPNIAKPMGVKLSQDVMDALRRIADREERSMSWLVDRLVRERLEQMKEIEPVKREPKRL